MCERKQYKKVRYLKKSKRECERIEKEWYEGQAKTPMKPLIEGDVGAWGSWWYICPVCRNSIDYKQTVCECGQKIKWEECK